MVASKRCYLEFANLTQYPIIVAGVDDDDYDWDEDNRPSKKYNGYRVEPFTCASQPLECANRARTCNIHMILQYGGGPHEGSSKRINCDQRDAFEGGDGYFRDFPDDPSQRRGSPDFYTYQIAHGEVNRFLLVPNGPNGGNLGDWMAELDDKLDLFHMLIPGSHDSTARGESLAGGASAQCQDHVKSSIREQLDQGIRAFDFRFEYVSGNRVISVHGIANQRYDAWDIIRELGEWANRHPLETVFAKIRGNSDCSPKLIEAMKGNEGEPDYTDHFWRKPDWPKNLGEARGKVICITENSIGDPSSFGGVWSSGWPDNCTNGEFSVGWRTFHVQDNYNNPDMSDKWKHIDAMLDTSARMQFDRWAYNFTSASGIWFPNAYASGSPGFWGMNRRLMDRMSTIVTPPNGRVARPRPKGIIFMDYFREPMDMNALPRIMAALNHSPLVLVG